MEQNCNTCKRDLHQSHFIKIYDFTHKERITKNCLECREKARLAKYYKNRCEHCVNKNHCRYCSPNPKQLWIKKTLANKKVVDRETKAEVSLDKKLISYEFLDKFCKTCSVCGYAFNFREDGKKRIMLIRQDYDDLHYEDNVSVFCSECLQTKNRK